MKGLWRSALLPEKGREHKAAWSCGWFIFGDGVSTAQINRKVAMELKMTLNLGFLGLIPQRAGVLGVRHYARQIVC